VKYVYAALLLHASDKEINEENINKIITSTGETVDEARVKALVASLAEINIDEAIKVSPGIATAPIPQTQPSVPEKEAEEEEEEKEEEAIAGLGALFG
jgi:large subunit ribosomal protein L12